MADHWSCNRGSHITWLFQFFPSCFYLWDSLASTINSPPLRQLCFCLLMIHFIFLIEEQWKTLKFKSCLLLCISYCYFPLRYLKYAFILTWLKAEKEISMIIFFTSFTGLIGRTFMMRLDYFWLAPLEWIIFLDSSMASI